MNLDLILLLLILNETVSNATRLDQIMSDQDQLNADVAAEGDLLTTVENEIVSLKAQPAAANLDFSGVDKMLSRLKGDAAAAAPAPAAPNAPAASGQPAQAPAAPNAPAQPAAPGAPTAPVTPPPADAPVTPAQTAPNAPGQAAQPGSVPNGLTTSPANPPPAA